MLAGESLAKWPSPLRMKVLGAKRTFYDRASTSAKCHKRTFTVRPPSGPLALAVFHESNHLKLIAYGMR